MPRLDLPAVEGATMAHQASAQRMPPPGPAVAAAPSFIQRQTGTRDSSYQSQPTKPAGPQFLPSDVLPEEARRDPHFREGAGSMYASSQPDLAMKYGVMRGKNHIPPQQLTDRSIPGKLKESTIEDIKTIADLQSARQKVESPDGVAESESAASGAGQAARFGQSKSDERPMSEEDRRRVANSLDEFDFHTMREMMMKDTLNTKEQRALIEERLLPMDLSDYVSHGYVEQEVPINSKLTYTFRSVDAATDLALKRLVVKEAKGFAIDDRYILDKYAIMSMTCMLSRINKTVLPDYCDENGNFSDERFWEKFNKVTRLGLHIIASVGVNSFWFDVRVRKLCVAEKISFG